MSSKRIPTNPNQMTSDDEDESEGDWHSTARKPLFIESEVDTNNILFSAPLSPIRCPSPLFVPDDLPIDPPVNNANDGHANESEISIKSYDPGAKEYLFCYVIGHSGISITDSSIIMERDEDTIRTYLNKWTCGKIPGEGGASKVEKFQTSMESYFNIRQNMKAALHPCIIRGNGKMIQNSLFHILLTVDGLQKFTTTLLFKQIESYSLVAESREEVYELRLVLEQFKWISNWEDPVFIRDELIKYIDNATLIGQREIINTLPEIIPSECHQKLAVHLLNLVKKGDNVPAMMDCLSDIELSLSDANKISYNKIIIEQMMNASLIDFPSYFGYLLKSKSPKILGPTIDMIRRKIEIFEIPGDTRCDIHMGEIVEKVRFMIIQNSNIVSVWSKIVKKELMIKGEIYPLDLLMLLIFVDNSNEVIPILKGIFKRKELATAIFNPIYEYNMPMIIKILESFLKICDSILQGKDSVSARVVSEVLANVFNEIDQFEGQEIVRIFYSNFINGTFDSRSAIIDALTNLSQKNPTKMLAFSVQFMDILDYIDRFPLTQLKGILNVIVKLAFIEGNIDSKAFNSQLHLMNRKQLTHTMAHIRCYGVISSLSIIRQVCISKGQRDSFTAEEEGRIKEILDIAWSFVENDSNPCILFFDELVGLVDILPYKIVERYEDILMDKFMNNWTRNIDRIKEFKSKSGLKMELQFVSSSSLDDQEDSIGFVIEGDALGMDPSVISAHFKIVRILHEKLNGNVKQIESFVGDPLLFPVLFGSSSIDMTRCTLAQKDKLGIYLIISINLFREQVSGFINLGLSDNKLMVSIWFRLYNIVKMQKVLNIHFPKSGLFTLAYPMDGIYGGSRSSNQMGQGSSKKVTKSGKKRKASKGVGIAAKKKKSGSNLDIDPATSNEDTIPESTAYYETDLLSKSIQPNYLFKFIRRLDSKVFVLLKYKLELANQPEFDTQSFEILLLTLSSTPPTQPTIDKISIEMEVLLLTELIQQVEHSNKLDIFSVERLILYICKHLDQLYEVLKNGSEPNPLNSSRLYECFILLLKVLYLYFEEMVYCEENKRRKHYGIYTLGKRTFPDPKAFGGLALREQIKYAVDYITRFAPLLVQPEEAIEYLEFLNKLSMYDELEDDKDNHPFKSAISETSLFYLKRDWILDTMDVGVILEFLLQNNKENLDLITEIIGEIIPTDDKALIPKNDIYKSCRIENLNGWISGLFSNMGKIMFKKTDKKTAFEESRRLWMNAFDIYKNLVNISQKLDQDVILEPILKFSRSFLGIIFQDGLKIVKWICENEPKNIRAFVKNIQLPARRLHYICNHAKTKKRMILLRHVPFIRKLIEKILVRVMAIMVSAGYSSNFVVAHLKKRTLKGEDIPKTQHQMGLDNEEDFTQSNFEDFSQIWNYNPSVVNQEIADEEDLNEKCSGESDPDSLSNSMMNALREVECLLEEGDGGDEDGEDADKNEDEESDEGGKDVGKDSGESEEDGEDADKNEDEESDEGGKDVGKDSGESEEDENSLANDEEESEGEDGE